jgi:hypothetical protein
VTEASVVIELNILRLTGHWCAIVAGSF